MVSPQAQTDVYLVLVLFTVGDRGRDSESLRAHGVYSVS